MKCYIFIASFIVISAIGRLTYAVEQHLSIAEASGESNNSTFVTEQSCAKCHVIHYKEWETSHHALAMQDANDQTVLADFNNTQFISQGITSRFFQQNGKYMVNTDGPDGKLADFTVRYVFGYEPLQQYLLEFTNGRFQALSVAWDTHNFRWFHLLPNEKITYKDELHWSKPSHNWNSNCAECHSTNLKKNYDAEADSYKTSFQQISVGCQGCHGPASKHLEWASKNSSSKDSSTVNAEMKGFQIDYKGTNFQVQLESCARCHSRRSMINPEYTYGQRLMDTHLPELLVDPLYFDDGQIKDEVYVYGSFSQSKMAAKGVRCSDCHNPHSAKLKTKGNALCTGCHNSTESTIPKNINASGLQKKNYDNRSHHFHEPGSAGSYCVNCHAPTRTYMGVDPRADHSFRIPRPDLSEKIGTPNACSNCHQDKSVQWATQAIAKNHPNLRKKAHYAEAFNAGRTGKKDAVRLLANVVEDKSQAPIVRATALQLLKPYPGEISGNLVIDSLSDPDPLVRRTAVSGFESASPEQRVHFLKKLLTDPVLAVRIEATRLLASVPPLLLDKNTQNVFNTTLEQLKASYQINLDRAEGHINFANLYLKLGQLAQAEKSYLLAVDFDPIPVVAIINLADLYRMTQRESEAEILLQQGLNNYPFNPALTQSLVFSLIRQQRKAEALQLLEQAYNKTNNVELAYLFAIALNNDNQRMEAIKVLENVLPTASGNRNIFITLAVLYRDVGNNFKATKYLKKLAEINPADPAVTQRR